MFEEQQRLLALLRAERERTVALRRRIRLLNFPPCNGRPRTAAERYWESAYLTQVRLDFDSRLDEDQSTRAGTMSEVIISQSSASVSGKQLGSVRLQVSVTTDVGHFPAETLYCQERAL